MTKGIIDRWADKYHYERLSIMIIEELKKEIEKAIEFSDSQGTYVNLKILLGDNEE